MKEKNGRERDIPSYRERIAEDDERWSKEKIDVAIAGKETR